MRTTFHLIFTLHSLNTDHSGNTLTFCFLQGFSPCWFPDANPGRYSLPKTLFTSTEQLNNRQAAVKVSVSSVLRCRTVMKQHCVVSAASCSISCPVQKSVRDDVNTWHRWSSASCAGSPGISVETQQVLLQRQVAVKHCQMRESQV